MLVVTIKALNSLDLIYLRDCLLHYTLSWSLRSVKSKILQVASMIQVCLVKTHGRLFLGVGPQLWKSFLLEAHQSLSLDIFWKQHKTFLFEQVLSKPN